MYSIDKILFYFGCLFVGQLTFRIAANLTASDLFFILSITAFFAKKIFQKEKIISKRTLILHKYIIFGIFLYLTNAILLVLVSNEMNKEEHLTTLLKFLFSSAILIYGSIVILEKEKEVVFAILCLGISGAINGFGALLQTLISTDIIPNTEATYGRMTGFTQHVNDLSSVSAVLIIPLIAALKSIESFSKKLLFFIMLMLNIIAMILSGSLSGIIAATVGYMAFLYKNKDNFIHQFIYISVITITILFLSSYFQTDQTITFEDKLNRVLYGNSDYDSTSTMRLETFKYAFEAIQENIFSGRGLVSGGYITPSGLQVHNVILASWYESGLFGMLGLLIILLSATMIIRASLSKKSRKSIILLGLYGGLISLLVYSMTAPVLIQRHLWIVLAIGLTYSNILRKTQGRN